jgi:hypothetical protein
MRRQLNMLAVFLAVALIVSLSVTGLLLSANAQLNADNEAKGTRLQMQNVLAKAQMAAQAEIKKVDALVVSTSLNLSAYGLNGSEARARLNSSLAANANLMSLITYDRNGIVQAAEPSSYYYLMGENLSGADNVQRLLAQKIPIMSNVITGGPNGDGAVLAAPVFDADGLFLGGVSGMFNVSTMLGSALPKLLNGTSFTFWSIQLDGLEIYDTDAAQIGMNLLGPAYADFPQAQAMGWRMVNESSGYVTYSFYTALHSGVLVNKECYWTSIGAHNFLWRLSIAHRM